VKSHVHRRISEAVAQELWPDTDCWTLIKATGTADWPGTGIRHHPTKDSDNVTHIQNLTRRARYQYLEARLSLGVQRQLGDIFHLIQDGFISSESMEAHNLIEAEVSRYLEQFTFYGIDAQTLTTQRQVFDLIRGEMRPLESPEQILSAAFNVCLSVASAISSPRGRFELGERANDLIRQAGTLLQAVEGAEPQQGNPCGGESLVG
jgi:hypothetical protein